MRPDECNVVKTKVTGKTGLTVSLFCCLGVEDKNLRVSSRVGTWGTRVVNWGARGTRVGTLSTRGTRIGARWKGLEYPSLVCRKGKGRSSSVRSLLLDYQPG